METFIAGDRVEFIDDKTQGVVMSVIDKDQLLILLDEGLEIPVYKSKLIKISSFKGTPSSLEEKYKEDIIVPVKISKETTGIFIAINKSNTNHLEYNLLNDTCNYLYFTFYCEENSGIKALTRGQLIPFHYSLIHKQALTPDAELSRYTICLLPFNELEERIQKPLVLNFSPSPKHIGVHNPVAPLLNKRALLIPLRSSAEEKKSQKPIFQNKTIELQELPKSGFVDVEKPDFIIDLHIEKIHSGYALMTRQEIFNYQVDYFQNSLDKAIALGYNKIVFIHGIGVNTLKSKIVEILKKNSSVGSFGDADIRKYGFGATEVAIKN